MSIKSINQIQDEIIEEFSILGDDRESTIFYIMEMGQKLAPLSNDYKTDENIIKGCQSKVWLVAEVNDENLEFKSDSNTDITKGLISKFVGQTARKMYADNPEIYATMEKCFCEQTVIEEEMVYHFQSTGAVRDFIVRYAYVHNHQSHD